MYAYRFSFERLVYAKHVLVWCGLNGCSPVVAAVTVYSALVVIAARLKRCDDTVVCLVQAIFTEKPNEPTFSLLSDCVVYLRVRSLRLSAPALVASRVAITGRFLRLSSLSGPFVSPTDIPQIIWCVRWPTQFCAIHTRRAHNFVLNFTFRQSSFRSLSCCRARPSAPSRPDFGRPTERQIAFPSIHAPCAPYTLTR